MGSTLSFPTVQLPEDRIFLITGGNTGIGYETAKQIATMGSHVIIACRNEVKAKAAVENMQQEFQCAKKDGKLGNITRDKLNVEYMIVDLASLKSTMAFIEKFIASGKLLHVLICNAGIGFAPRSYTEDGYESMFQVNYLSQFLIMAHLLPVMRRSGDDCRIVLVSSIAHKFASFNMSTIQGKEVSNFNRMKYYGNSKMYQIMQMYSMVRRLQGSNITVTSLHPGIVDSELSRNFQDRFYYKHIYTVGRLFGVVRNLYQGSATSLTCAVSPELKGTTGVYFVDAKPATSSRESRNIEYQEQVWKYTLDCLKDYLSDDVIAGLKGVTSER